ncbi:MAG: aldehyde dehydrogenase family protein [Nocardioides sp.]|nr:aldehyde dehydrogenase family protein [Nocardioides sp.]
MTSLRPFFVAGKRRQTDESFAVTHPGDGSFIADVAVPKAGDIDEAVEAAHVVQHQLEGSSALVRARALDHVSAQLARRRQEIAEVITSESGKPIRWAQAEVQRSVATFRIAAEETRRFSGELMRLDTEEGYEGRLALVRRFSRGPVLAIAPFNFPLNLVAHKVAPAIAVGAPVIIKPAPTTPLSSLLLGEILAETELPEGSWSVLPVRNDQMADLVSDPRLPVISFTGSADIGWMIREMVPRKHVTLELGGNGTAVVCADYSSEADLEYAAGRIAKFAMYQAGQSCISVQTVLADESLYERLRDKVAAAVAAQPVGDVWDPNTSVGPMISEAAAERVEQWVQRAASSGAKILTGGHRDKALFGPTLLTDVDAQTEIATEEVFGPVVSISPVAGFDAAVERINSSRYGLQAGVFTHDIATAFQAHRALQVGGVIIGDVPTFRADQMPYGGVKDSGIGREGVAAAMTDMTYERVLVLNGL